jgi:hypothetical protein
LEFALLFGGRVQRIVRAALARVCSIGSGRPFESPFIREPPHLLFQQAANSMLGEYTCAAYQSIPTLLIEFRVALEVRTFGSRSIVDRLQALDFFF